MAKAAAKAKEKPAPVADDTKNENPKQNGVRRPEPGTLTGKLWDIADEISAQLKRPAPRGAVIEKYLATVPGANKATAATQYSRWVVFHDAGDALKLAKAKEKEERDKEKAAEKEAKAKEKAAKEAQAKKDADAKAAAKAKADKEKAAA